MILGFSATKWMSLTSFSTHSWSSGLEMNHFLTVLLARVSPDSEDKYQKTVPNLPLPSSSQIR